MPVTGWLSCGSDLELSLQPEAHTAAEAVLRVSRLWNGDSGACMACLREHSQPVYSLAFSPDGSMLASGSFDRFLHVWRTADGACLRSFQGAQPLLCCLSVALLSLQRLLSGLPCQAACWRSSLQLSAATNAEQAGAG